MHNTQILKKTQSINLSIATFLVLLLNLVITSAYSQNLEESQLTSVEIYKSSSNSYNLVNDTAFIKPFFDTTYIISGSSTSLNITQNIVNSTIINDFMLSPTVGYVLQSVNNTNGENDSSRLTASLSNPFVDIDTISERIQQELSQAVSNATNIDYNEVDIKCTFGENIQDWKCEVFTLPI
ncbi:MAG: hypothetical protein M3Y25_05565 [Thermoproteota archaeon]|nr:hypothetical protein [Thermoproteota archaeon]